MSVLPTIRSRLTKLLVAVALAWGLGVSVAVWLVVAREVDELLDETLQASAQVLGHLLGRAAIAGAPDSAAVDAASSGPQQHFAWQLVGRDGVRLRSARAPLQPLLPLPVAGFTDVDGWRVYSLPLADGTQALYVAQTRAERREAVAEAVTAAIGSALAIAVLSAWWLQRRVRRELRPLDQLARALARYEPLSPSTPLEAPTRRELLPVHHAIEALGERLARRVANERAFSAHAAHALRTPLAGIDMQLAVAEREAPHSLQPRLSRAREAAGRLTQVVSALLALFRSGSEVQHRPIDLQALLDRLPHEPLTLQVQADLPLDADEDLLTAALINLLDNAVRHGAHTLRVELQGRDGLQRVRLHDDGSGVTRERRAELVQALADQAYEGRMGLGLMLADLVARAHGGLMTLPEVTAGFAVEISFAKASMALASSAPSAQS